MAILKAVKVITKWADGSSSIEEFSVSEYNDPIRMARKVAMSRMLDDDYLFISIQKVYAAPGERVNLIVVHSI